MIVGIVGSGKVGKALGAWAEAAGCHVLFTSRKAADAQEAARRAGSRAQGVDIATVVRESDLILLTLPFTEIAGVLTPLGSQIDSKILVDVSNPITPDRRDLTIGHTSSGAEEIARQFPKARIVKGFNAVFAEVYESRRPEIDGQPISIFYAGDNAEAKSAVRRFITTLGFDAVDAGSLHNARYLEPLSLLNITLGRELGYGTQIGFSLKRQQRLHSMTQND
jgi:8-hydroxy-5-deazaflavin:NADPH oxidoreductase